MNYEYVKLFLRSSFSMLQSTRKNMDFTQQKLSGPYFLPLLLAIAASGGVYNFLTEQ